MKKLSVFIALIAFFGLSLVNAQTREITGSVTSAEDGLGVIGANVIVKGTTVGVATDIDGNFSINVPEGYNVLTFDALGFAPQEITITGSVINVILKSANIALDEVVVIGYGTQKKSEMTGAVAKVKTEQLSIAPVASPEQALQGKVAGVQIVNTSGRAGSSAQISVRGNGSLSASNSVLYVIDGVPGGDFGSITPDDIQSIEVLKDAASAAIYGSRASNGVVLVTTKSGKFDQPTQINFNSFVSIDNLINEPELLNADQYKMILDESRNNYLADIAAGNLAAPDADDHRLEPYKSLGHNTNWMDEILNRNAVKQSYSVNITGGSAKTKFYASASYFDQNGVIKNDTYKKYRAKLNLTHCITDKFKVGFNTAFSQSIAVPLAEDNSSYTPWGNAMGSRPDAPTVDENGKAIDNPSVNNPLFAFERKVSSKWTTLAGVGFADWDIIDGLKYHFSISGNIANNRYNRFNPPSSRQGLVKKKPVGFGYYGTEYNTDFLVENTLTYIKRVFDDKLKITVLAGHTYQQYDWEDSYVSGKSFPSDNLRWLVSAGEINEGRSYWSGFAMESVFGRAQFSLLDKYNLMFLVRRDGTSKFNKDNKYGTFPSVSAGWNISNEDFFPEIGINTMKVRASYGQTGNQEGISYASGQNLIGSGYNYNLTPGLASGSLYNPDLHWETGHSYNFGLDVAFWDNRVNFSGDIYSKSSKDLLYSLPVPQETGYSTIQSNIGETSNKGFEVITDVNILKNGELKWNFSANFSYNKNEVVKLGGPTDNFTTGFVSIVKEGEEMGSFILYNSLGVAQEKYEYKNKDGKVTKTVLPGDMIYEDVNGDGYINDKDKQVYNGGIAPMYGGISTHLEYKNFDLTINAQYSIGKKVYAMYKQGGTGNMNGGAVGYPSYSRNMITDMLDRWTPENTNTDVPRAHMETSVVEWNHRHSTRFLEDADYLRISNITLGYNLPKSILSKIYLTKARVFVQGANLLTITKYSGNDPEVQYIDPDRDNNKTTAGVDVGGIPNAKSIVFGVNVSF